MWYSSVIGCSKKRKTTEYLGTKVSKIKSAYWNVIDGGDYEQKPKKPENQAFKAASSYQRTNELRNKLKARFKVTEASAMLVANASVTPIPPNRQKGVYDKIFIETNNYVMSRLQVL